MTIISGQTSNVKTDIDIQALQRRYHRNASDYRDIMREKREINREIARMAREKSVSKSSIATALGVSRERVGQIIQTIESGVRKHA